MAKAGPTLYYFVSHRDVNVGSLTGRSILFERGIPTHVPRDMHREVMEKGILPCDKDGKIVDDVQAVSASVDTPKVLLAPEDPHEREDAIKVAIKAIVERNNPHDFSAGGVPIAGTVSSATGWRVDPREIRAIWAIMKPELMGSTA